MSGGAGEAGKGVVGFSFNPVYAGFNVGELISGLMLRACNKTSLDGMANIGLPNICSSYLPVNCLPPL